MLENVNMKQDYQNAISKLLGCKPIKINSSLVSAQNRVRLYWTNIPGTEQGLFEKLIGVSGIGPKTALAMISTPVDQFQKAIAEGDVPFLTRIPGLGKKTAERLIVELRGKLNLETAGNTQIPKSAAATEATDALRNLGYEPRTISEILSDAPTDATTEELVKFFLSSNA